MPTVILYNPKERVKLKVPYLPFSIMTIGSELKKAGYSVRLIDARVEDNAAAMLKDAVAAGDVVFFGVTLITGSVIHDALDAVRLVREKSPGTPVVFGGVHASLLPEETVRHELIDYVVVGPGEEAVVELVDCLLRKKAVDGIAGLAFKKEGRIVVNPRKDALDRSMYSGIDYGMLDLSKYIKREAVGERCLDYLSSRGCPHPCAYCAISRLWRREIVFYPAERMVDDIERLVREQGIDGIHFLDDNFFVNRKRVEAFCDEVIRRGLKLRFWSMCRCNYFSKFEDSFLARLREAGFHTMNFGAESGSQFILDRIKKGITVEQIEETARKCDRFGFRGQFSFMTGFPFETDEDHELTVRMIDRLHAINPGFDIQLFPFTPFPKTELAEECMKHGYVPPENLEDWARFEYGNISMPWLSPAIRKRNETLTMLAWFAFTTETAIKLGAVQGALFRLFGKLARFRWRHRLFRFPLEWRVINFLARQS